MSYLTQKIINESIEPKDLEGFVSALHALVDKYVANNIH